MDAPGEIDHMIARADSVRAHTFDLLGSGPVNLGSRIDWHCDFKSGYRWDPSRHYTGIRVVAQPGVDVKVPWELSRGQHLPLLAQTYLLTGKAEYAKEAVDQILDWIDTNAPEFGVNWTCPMDAAIRAVNWLWTAALLSPSREATQKFFEELLASLLAHGRYLRTNLEVMPNGIRTNHYVADLVGLFYLGLCVPEFEHASEWAEFARAELATEISRQVLPDGVSYESSIPYHRLAAEMFVSAALTARHNGASFDPDFLERLTRMMSFTAAYLKPNGLCAQVGDADDGRLHVLSGYGSVDPRDHRHLLAASAVLFGREDWYALSGERWIEALWLGGAPTRRRPRAPCAQQPSAAFKHAGIYILRSASDMVTFTAGCVGSDGLGNHKHNDVLAFDLCLDGEDLFVDPGSYLYTSDPEARDAFRSTCAHNTVMIDGVEQNEIHRGSLFSLHSNATPRLIEWNPELRLVTAEHDGYCRLTAPIIHRRTVRLEAPHTVHVEDAFIEPERKAAHELRWTFALAAGAEVMRDGAVWIITTAGRRRFRVTWPTDERGLPLDIEVETTTGSVSPRYGMKQLAPTLRWTWRGRPPRIARFVVDSAPPINGGPC